MQEKKSFIKPKKETRHAKTLKSKPTKQEKAGGTDSKRESRNLRKSTVNSQGDGINYEDEITFTFYEALLKGIMETPETIAKETILASQTSLKTDQLTKSFKDILLGDLENTDIVEIVDDRVTYRKKSEISLTNKSTCESDKSISKVPDLGEPSEGQRIVKGNDSVSTISPSGTILEMEPTKGEIGHISSVSDGSSAEVQKVRFKNGNVYEGLLYKKTIPSDAKAICWWADGTTYEGDFCNGFPQGHGSMELPDTSHYVGSIYKGFFHGKGVYNIRNTPIIYSGDWKYGKKHGKGWILYEADEWYEGEFKDDLREGYGIRKYKNGAFYEGQWTKGLRNGQGAMRWPNGDIYVGTWKDGIIDGFGEYTWKANLNLWLSFPIQNHFIGTWENGVRNGLGKMHFGLDNGAKLVGRWKRNFKHGAGIMICGNGKLVEGNPLFVYDKPKHMVAGVVPDEEELVVHKARSKSLHQLIKSINTHEVRKEIDPKIMEQIDKRINKSVHKIKPVNAEFLGNISGACNPMEVLIQTPAENVDMTYYIYLILKEHTTLYDVIQFGSDIDSGSSNECGLKERGEVFSKWNMLPSSKIYPHARSTMGAGDSKSTEASSFYDRSEEIMHAEIKYLKHVIVRYLPRLTEIYYHYATMIMPTIDYHRHYMIRLFLWQLYVDAEVPKEGVALFQTDLILAENNSSAVEDPHDPFEYIYFFQFLQSLLGTSWLLFRDNITDFKITEGIAAFIFKKFLIDYIFPNAGKHKGRCLFEFKDLLPIKSVYAYYKELGELLTARDFLNLTCCKKGEEPPCYKSTLDQKQVMATVGSNVVSSGQTVYFISNDYDLGEKLPSPAEPQDITDVFYQDLQTFRSLGAKTVVKCLCAICPPIMKNGIIHNIGHKLTFWEFYEVLILCSIIVSLNERKKKDEQKGESVPKEEVQEDLAALKSKKSISPKGKRMTKK